MRSSADSNFFTTSTLMKTLIASLLSTLFFANVCQAQGLPPIKSVAVKPNDSIFKAATRDKPLVIKSAADATKHFPAEGIATLKKEVDFDKQIVLVFAWRGSGQDKLSYSVLESFPEQIVFNFKRGRTKDLRPHTLVFVLRSNVRWKTAAGPGIRPVKPIKPAKAGEYIKVEVQGKLRSQVFAIGGETTGVTISASGVTWELDLGRNADVRKSATELNGKTVVVTGRLSVKRGVEIRQRWIVTVDALRAAGGAKVDDGAFLTPEGTLKHSLVLRDAQSGFAGESGQIWTISSDGSWKVTPFLNRNIRDATASGKLSGKQLGEIANSLAQAKFNELPNRIGKFTGANPHTVSIKFGEQQAALVMRGGISLPAQVDSKTHEQRFASLVHALRSKLKSDD